MKTRKEAKPRTPSSHAVDRRALEEESFEMGV
jgi:hypothetical protein